MSDRYSHVSVAKKLRDGPPTPTMEASRVEP